MPKQVQKTKAVAERQTEPDSSPSPTIDSTKLKADLNDLLDEIDGVLETNAETFVRDYVQKGGE